MSTKATILSSKRNLNEEELLRRHYPIVGNVVGKMMSRLPASADFEELHSVGVTGLVTAVKNCDRSKMETFEGYIAIRVRGAVLDHLRKLDQLPRSARQKARKLSNVVEKLEQSLSRTPTDEEIRSELQLTEKEFARMKKQTESYAMVSLDGAPEASADESQDLHQAIADESQPISSEVVEREELQGFVAEHIKQLPERQQKILAMYYFENMRMGDIAEVFGVSQARICQLHLKALDFLRKHCEALVSPVKQAAGA